MEKVDVAPAEGEATILVAVDASKQAEDAAKFYIQTVYNHRHQVSLIHVVELPEAQPIQRHVTPAEVESMWQRERTKAVALQAKYMDMFKNYGLVGCKFRDGRGFKPGEAIAEAAKEMKASMIVMGSRGMGTVRRTFIGSTSDYVMHHAHCPVLVCRF